MKKKWVNIRTLVYIRKSILHNKCPYVTIYKNILRMLTKGYFKEKNKKTFYFCQIEKKSSLRYLCEGCAIKSFFFMWYIIKGTLNQSQNIRFINPIFDTRPTVHIMKMVKETFTRNKPKLIFYSPTVFFFMTPIRSCFL